MFGTKTKDLFVLFRVYSQSTKGLIQNLKSPDSNSCIFSLHTLVPDGAKTHVWNSKCQIKTSLSTNKVAN